ncbi:spore germination protein GerW family protein [Leucobacter salsicius]|uniref:spore germination protein GerW family protein n=1 Tax=Leucobacter salsicius TaxID=664638 RepID=UPI000347747B|nr:spore germination protein GerW family protein [Leucobacter salsicius]
MAHLTKEIADTLTQVGVHSAYGDPVQLGDATIMPVACTSYGFGAGEAGAGTEGEGSGGGGGGMAVPVGAYVSRDGVTRFEPNIIALLVVGVPFVCVAGRALARVIRALKR